MYYAELLTIYRDPDAPASKLQPLDELECVDPSLERALESLCEVKRCANEFHEWCANSESISQLEIVAIFRLLLTMAPSKSTMNLDCGMSALKMCRRLDVDRKYPAEWAVARRHFDSVLLRSISCFKSEGSSTRGRFDNFELGACGAVAAWPSARCRPKRYSSIQLTRIAFYLDSIA